MSSAAVVIGTLRDNEEKDFTSILTLKFKPKYFQKVAIPVQKQSDQIPVTLKILKQTCPIFSIRLVNKVNKEDIDFSHPVIASFYR